MIEKPDLPHCFGAASIFCLAANPLWPSQKPPWESPSWNNLPLLAGKTWAVTLKLRADLGSGSVFSFICVKVDRAPTPKCQLPMAIIEGFFFEGDPLCQSHQIFLVTYNNAGGSWAASKTSYPFRGTHCVLYMWLLYIMRNRRKFPFGVTVLVKGREEKT